MENISRKYGVMKIILETFDDMAFYMISRATGIVSLVTVLCSSEECFTIVPLGDGAYIYISSPPPDRERSCKYYYVDDIGNLVCSQKPSPARTNLLIVRVKEITEYMGSRS
ncbi:MAG: hypothetical protein QXJ51_04735 [Sulfolobales archaeon]